MDIRDCVGNTMTKRSFDNIYKKDMQKREEIVWALINKIYEEYKHNIGNMNKAEVSNNLGRLHSAILLVCKGIDESLESLKKRGDVHSTFGKDAIVGFLQDHDVVTDNTVKSHLFIAKEVAEKIWNSIGQDLEKLRR